MDFPATQKFGNKHGDALVQENRQLKQRLDLLERENKSLKKSLFDVSLKLDTFMDRKDESDSVSDYFNLEGLDEDEPTKQHFLTVASSEDLQGLLGGKSRNDIRHEKQSQDSMQFSCCSTLSGHDGAIYACRFSPDGQHLASASWDKSVVVWNASGGDDAQQCRLSGHSRAVADVCWTGEALASAGFDGTVRRWSVERERCTHTHTLLDASANGSGVLLCVEQHQADPAILFAGSSTCQLLTFDERTGHATPSATLRTPTGAMVNTIVEADERHVVSGDAHGFIRVWDRRVTPASSDAARVLPKHALPPGCIDQIRCGTGLPLAHMSTTSDLSTGALVATTSYDNVLRIHQRSLLKLKSGGGDDASKSTHTALTTASGHAIRNWPVRCAWFVGENYGTTEADTSLSGALLCVTGGSDGAVCIVDVRGALEHSDQQASGAGARLLQRIASPAARVYGVDVHPRAPLIAAAGDDGALRLYAPKRSAPLRDSSNPSD